MMVWLIIVVQIDSVEAEWEYSVYVYLIISNNIISNAKIIYLPCLCQCAMTDLIPILCKANIHCFFPPSINFMMQIVHNIICTLIDSNMYKCTLF